MDNYTLILDFIDYILHLYSFCLRTTDMAFKRSAVRSRLSPPKASNLLIRCLLFCFFKSGQQKLRAQPVSPCEGFLLCQTQQFCYRVCIFLLEKYLFRGQGISQFRFQHGCLMHTFAVCLSSDGHFFSPCTLREGAIFCCPLSAYMVE